MTRDEIMKIENPNEALLAMEKKVETENLNFTEMIEMVEKYTKVHGITSDEMAYYPNGEQVITPSRERD